MGNAMKIAASIGYYLMTAVIWSSADNKQIKSLSCFLYFVECSPFIFIIVLSKQNPVVLQDYL